MRTLTAAVAFSDMSTINAAIDPARPATDDDDGEKRFVSCCLSCDAEARDARAMTTHIRVRGSRIAVLNK